MARKVSVDLSADVAPFVVEVGRAGHETAKLDHEVEQLDRDLDKLALDSVKAGVGVGALGEAAKRTGPGLDDMDKKSTRASDSADKLGTKSKATASALDVLARKILETEAALKALRTQFAATGDIGLLTQIRAQRSELSQLTKVRKEYDTQVKAGRVEEVAAHQAAIEALKSEHWLPRPTAVKDEIRQRKDAILRLNSEIAAETAKAGASGAAQAFTMPGIGQVGWGVLGAASPALLAGAGGAVLATGGLAAAGGAAAAGFAADPKAVHAAWSAEIAAVKAEWINAGQAAVQPTINAIHTIGDAITSIHWDKLIATGAKFLEPLANAAGTAIGFIASGIETLVTKAGPEMAVLGKEIPELGRSFETALGLIAGGAEGGAKALGDLFHVVDAAVVSTGAMIGGLEHAYEWFGKANQAASDWLVSWHPVASKLNEVGGEAKSVAWRFRDGADAAGTFGAAGSEAFRGIDQRARDALATVGRLDAEFQNLFGTLMNVDQATIHYQQAVDDLTKSWQWHGQALDANSQAGRDDLKLIENIIKATERQREAAIQAGGGTAEAYAAANAAYLQQLQALRAQLKELGANTAAVDALITKYELLARPLTKTITVNIRENVTVSGQGVISGGDLRRSVGSAYAHGGIRHAAEGLIVPPRDPGTVLFGEPQTGGEALIPMQGISSASAQALMQTVGAGYGLDVSARNTGRPGSGDGGVREVRHVHQVDIMGGGELIRRLVITSARDRGQTVAQYLSV